MSVSSNSLTFAVYHKERVDCSKFRFLGASSIVNISGYVSDCVVSRVSQNRMDFTVQIQVSGKYNLSIWRGYEVLFNGVFSFDHVQGHPNLSSLHCHESNFMERWCEVENVCFEGKNLRLISPYSMSFEPIFMNPESRPIPFDTLSNRITNDTIGVIPSPICKYKEELNFLISRTANHAMLWHNLMDTTLPLYWTMREMTGGNATIRPNIVIYDDHPRWGLFYLKIVAKEPFTFITKRSKEHCFQKLVLGLKKSAQNFEFQRQRRDALTLPYKIPREEVKGFRETIMDSINCTETTPIRNHPIVFLVKRRDAGLKRNIINIDGLINKTRSLCPLCNVMEIDYQIFDKIGQIKATANISALIGIHGSGLIHTAWMAPSTKERPTAVIEITPYLYDCRHWYEDLARTSGVQYFRIPTTSRNNTRWDEWHNKEKAENCLSSHGMCGRIKCHDFLRDQSVIVDLADYQRITQPFFSSLMKQAQTLNR